MSWWEDWINHEDGCTLWMDHKGVEIGSIIRVSIMDHDEECSCAAEEGADCALVTIKVQRWDRSSYRMLTLMIDPHLCHHDPQSLSSIFFILMISANLYHPMQQHSSNINLDAPS